MIDHYSCQNAPEYSVNLHLMYVYYRGKKYNLYVLPSNPNLEKRTYASRLCIWHMCCQNIRITGLLATNNKSFASNAKKSTRITFQILCTCTKHEKTNYFISFVQYVKHPYSLIPSVVHTVRGQKCKHFQGCYQTI